MTPLREPAGTPDGQRCPGAALQPPRPAPAVLGAGACHSFACAIIDGMTEQMAVLAIQQRYHDGCDRSVA